jgi:glycosyltransferase involved in cell wall biosynthesis
MKILRVISSMNPKAGGPCQGIRNSIPEMKNLGAENEVVCFDSSEADYLGKDNFIVHTLGNVKTTWGYNKNLIPFLLNNFHRFDAVVVHGLWLYHSYATLKAWEKYKKTNKTFPKLFVMPHGMLDPYFQQAKNRKLKAIRNRFYWKMIENKVINNTDGVLFTCEEELSLAREPFRPYKPKQELNIGYGIQPPPIFSEKMTSAFAAKVPAWNGNPFILFLSRIHQKKGVDLLIKAYQKLEQENPSLLGRSREGLPQLIIAGPLENEYAKEMQTLANSPSLVERGAEEEVVFAGMLSGDEKWGAFYNCDCFVLPSHQENFGIAIVEAMACSKPVIITNKVNIWREIAEDVAGLVGNDTEEDTYNLLKKYLSFSFKEKQEMGEQAFLAYKKYFSIEKSAEKLLEVLCKNK